MSSLATAARRLNQTKDMLFGKTQDPNSIPWDPDNTTFPLRKDCGQQPGQPEGACWVWGKVSFVLNHIDLNTDRVRMTIVVG